MYLFDINICVLSTVNFFFLGHNLFQQMHQEKVMQVFTIPMTNYSSLKH